MIASMNDLVETRKGEFDHELWLRCTSLPMLPVFYEQELRIFGTIQPLKPSQQQQKPYGHRRTDKSPSQDSR